MSMTRVAQQAGVSQATVSRVVNRSAVVSQETRRKVEQAMRRVGYAPPQPRRRPGQRTRNGTRRDIRQIAVLVADDVLKWHGSFVIDMFRGVQQAAEREGISALMATMGDGRAIGPAIRRAGADGVLLVGFESHPQIQRELNRLPAVWLTSHAEPGTDAVLPGNEAVGRIAAKFLLDRGHRELAFLCAELDNPSYSVRGQAFQRAAESAGACVQHFVADSLQSDDDRQHPYEIDPVVERLVQRLLTSRPRPTGVFVPSDLMTALAYREMARQGVAAGRDIHFISCDNEAAYLAGLWPRPATVDIAGQARGRRAVHELLWQMNHPQEQRAVQLTVEPRLILTGHDQDLPLTRDER